MLLIIEKSGKQDKESSKEWLVNLVNGDLDDFFLLTCKNEILFIYIIYQYFYIITGKAAKRYTVQG